MYRLIKASKYSTGIVRHEVKTSSGDEEFRYYGIRFALVWPTATSPAFFLGGGSEVYDDKLDAISGNIIRVVVEKEYQGLVLDGFFDALTDQMTSHLAEIVYADLTKEDFKDAFYGYLDRRGLRNITAQQAPYSDNFVLRIGKVKDCDEAGNLLVDKGSPLYSDLRGISRLDLQDEPEVRFFRLNCLSMLIAGFDKYGARLILDLRGLRKGRPGGWMLCNSVEVQGAVNWPAFPRGTA